MKRPSSCIPAGFTLLELILVLTIMSIVSTLGVTGLFRMTLYWNDLQSTLRMNAAATHAFESFAKDFESVLSARVVGVGLRGQQADIEDNVRFWRLSFEDDSLTAPVEQYNPLTGAQERLSVQYAIDRHEDEPRLVRTTTPLGDAVRSGTQSVAASGIVGMRIQYFDGNDWRGNWDGSAMPEMVRVSLSMMADNRTDQHLSRVATFRIHVK